MRPTLFSIGPLEVNAWGVMAALAALAAARVLTAGLRRYGEDPAAAWPLVLAGALGGIAGAKLYFLAEHPGRLTDLSASFSGAGFTWYGGMLGGALAVLLVAHRRHVSLPALLGAAAPTLALAYAIGRIGCQLAGDGTYGTASDLPWAMSYPDGIVPTTERVHPTPVYETLGGLVTFAVLWRLRDRMAPVRLFGLYLALAGAQRALVELVRRNDEVAFGLTQPQLWAIGLAAAGLGLLAARRPARLAPAGS